MRSNSSVVMFELPAARISINEGAPPANAVFRSPARTDLNGSFSFHSGCAGASSFTRSRPKWSWKYSGCSAQSVPSLSNVAMRSAAGTNSGEPSFVTFATKSTMDCFVLPSFHEGSGSAACATAVARDNAHESAERR